MAAITQLGLHGPQTAFGNITDKTVSESPAATITRYGLTGPMAAYATFLPKATGVGKPGAQFIRQRGRIRTIFGT